MSSIFLSWAAKDCGWTSMRKNCIIACHHLIHNVIKTSFLSHSNSQRSQAMSFETRIGDREKQKQFSFISFHFEIVKRCFYFFNHLSWELVTQWWEFWRFFLVFRSNFFVCFKNSQKWKENEWHWWSLSEDCVSEKCTKLQSVRISLRPLGWAWNDLVSIRWHGLT